MRKCLFFLVVIFMSTCSAGAQETLTWLAVHWPPIQILDGDDRGQGRFDALLDIYQKNLPQYEHKTIVINWGRFWTELQEGNSQICNMFAIKTPDREEYTEFSRAISWALPLRVIMRKDTIEKLGNPESLSIINLLEQSDLKGIIVKKRSYYSILDQHFRDHGANIQKLAIADKNIIQMLLAGRTDYTIEYPFVVNYLSREFEKSYTTELGSIAIEESPEGSSTYIACPKTDWGRKVIRDLDRVLDQVIPTPEYLQIMQMWHFDPREREAVRKGFEKNLLSTSK